MEDYARIEKAIRFLEENYRRQPSLEDIASHMALSPCHAQRLFKRWAGISPKQFIQYLTLGYAKTVLQNSGSVMDAAYASGLSGSSRLHDLFVTFDAVTPGEFKQKGKNICIRFGSHPSPFGSCLIGTTERGICWLSFYGNEGPERSLNELMGQWRGANFEENPRVTSEFAGRVFQKGILQNPLTLFLKGTNFQIKVWDALLKLSPGELYSYEFLATAIGMPKAARGVAAAISRNPVAFLIPCHRVLRKSAEIAGYRWGAVRKKAMIAWEAAEAPMEIHHG